LLPVRMFQLRKTKSVDDSRFDTKVIGVVTFLFVFVPTCDT